MRRNQLVVVLAASAVLFLGAGWALATWLPIGHGNPSSPEGAASVYQQVLNDLTQHYYRHVDIGKLGQNGINDALKSLHDPYTQYFTPQQAKAFDRLLSATYSGIGTVFQQSGKELVVARVLPGSPAQQAGIQVGDAIAAVNDRSTAGQPVDVIAARIRGPAGTKVRLTLDSKSGTRRTVVLTRRQIALPLTSSRIILDHGRKVGYVSLTEFGKGAGADVRRAVVSLLSRGATSFVFDLRNNGGGLVDEAVNVASDFLPAGSVVVSTQGLHSPREVLRTSDTPATRRPLVVLVNGNTASASEIVSGALQDHHRATLIGTRTFGKGVVQEEIPLSGGAALKITVAAYRTPNGRNINHKGIEPAIVVNGGQTTPANPAKDPQLERALQFLASGR